MLIFARVVNDLVSPINETIATQPRLRMLRWRAASPTATNRVHTAPSNQTEADRAMTLPPDHPLRVALNDEVHARPPEALVPPLRVSYLALLNDPSSRDAAVRPIADLAGRFGYPAPPAGANHFSADLGPFRVKWERHTEFTRYQFIVAGDVEASDPFAATALDRVPAEWIARLPGQVIVATHAALLPAPAAAIDTEQLSTASFDGNPLIGSTIADGGAIAYTDFRIRADGFSRLMLYARDLPPRQAGRSLQRLLEIDTYRVMALLALPVARELTPFLVRSEQELGRVTSAMIGAGEASDPDLLDRLTRLEAEIESRHADSYGRFAAADAYYDLVRRRITELREQRVVGLQNFSEFTDRRLAPAMSTCKAVARRQAALSTRVAQATQLLSTRVDIARERHNQMLLEQMNRRAHMQLRLQETVEGLSVAAVTYYVVGIFGYLFKGIKAAGYKFDTDLATGLAIPVVFFMVAFGLKTIKRVIWGDNKPEADPHP